MFDLLHQSKVSVPAAGWHGGNEEGGLEVAWYNMGGGGGCSATWQENSGQFMGA